MYDLADRFQKAHSNTPARVGPATYTLPDFIRGQTTQQYAPFLSTSRRLFSLISPDASLLPSASDYYPQYRKNRVLGGTSLRNRAQRAPKNKNLLRPGPATYNVYQKYQRKPGIGKLYVCRAPRYKKTTPTIPEKGLICYDCKPNGEIEKIIEPEGDTTLGPCFYNVPQGETCFNTKKYKVNNWSLMGEIRFKQKIEDTPGPGSYDISNKSLSPYKIVQEKICERLRNESKQERYLDKVVNITKRENIPGPGFYDIGLISKKTDKKKEHETFSKAARGNIYQIIEGPGPAAYADPRSALSKASKYTSYKGSPFWVDASRSPPPIEPSPGPSDYDPAKGLFYELQTKFYPEVTEKTPFSSTAARNTGFEKPDSYITPGPANYNLQKKLIKKDRKNNMFGNRSPRFTENIDVAEPTCATYSTEMAFNNLNNPKSHLKSTPAFLSTSKKSFLFDSSCSPAPGTYDPPDTSLKIHGCVFPRDAHKEIVASTPGPADYNPHRASSVLSTHNVTLKPDLKISFSVWHKMLTAKKKLKCFTKC